MRLVGLIPARGGSKGIPKKSIAPCVGKPLLQYTAEAALGSQSIGRVLLSTDDEEIAQVGRSLGLEVPFIRPTSIAQDATPMIDVIQHTIDWLKQNGETLDGIVLLQPTSPLRRSSHIDEAAKLFESSRAATVVSVIEVPHQFHPLSVMKMNDGHLVPYFESSFVPLRRQDKPVCYARNGPAVLIVRPDVIQSGKLYGDPTIGYLMNEADSIDVDGIADLKLAEAQILGH